MWILMYLLSGPVYYLIVFTLLPQRRRVAILAIGFLLLLYISGLFHTSIVPPRFDAGDLIVLGAAIAGVCVVATRMPDLACCAVFGFFQSLVLLAIFSNFYARDIRFGDPADVLMGWVVLSGFYMACVVGFCAVLRADLLRKRRNDDHSHCSCCGYDLFGLTEPRCPECGLEFSSDAGRR